MKVMIGGLVAVLAASVSAQAQTAYPTRPVTMIWPYSAGSTGDVIARAVASGMTKVLPQQVVVESKPGASGVIGFKTVSQATDPYTIGMTVGTMFSTTPLTSKTNKFEIGKDYLPICEVYQGFLVLAAHPSVPFRDVEGLMNYAKANPGKLNIASAGQTSNSGLAYELLKYQSKLDIATIPYKGTAALMPDLLSGAVDMVFTSYADVKQFVADGKLTVVGYTGPERDPAIPNLKTFKESGLPDFQIGYWQGLVAPPGTAQDVVDKLSKACIESLKDPEVRRVFDNFGFEIVGKGPKAMEERIRADLKIWEPIVKAANMVSE